MSQEMHEFDERIVDVSNTEKVQDIIACMNLCADIGRWEYQSTQVLTPDEVKVFQVLGYNVTETYWDSSMIEEGEENIFLNMFTISFK